MVPSSSYLQKDVSALRQTSGGYVMADQLLCQGQVIGT